MFQLERPENAIKHMAAHIAQRTVAEVIPAMPFVRVEIGMEIAIGSGPEPFLPMKTFRDGQHGRPGTRAAVGTVGPTVGLGDVAYHTGPDKFAEPPIAIFTVTLITHLRRGFGILGHLTQLASFSDIVTE